MKSPVLLLTYFVGLALACPSDFDSDALLDDTSSVSQNITRRWVEIVTTEDDTDDNPARPWPQDPGGSYVHTIRYCFHDWESWKQLNGLVVLGAKKWTDKLGKPGSKNKHALRIDFEAHAWPKTPPFCWTQPPPDGETHGGIFNPFWKPDTLVIKAEPRHGTPSAGALVGSKPRDWNHMFINIGLEAQGDLEQRKRMDQEVEWKIAHEWGHVFGLAHEHQRPDRDNYLHFDCTNILHYREVEDFANSQRRTDPNFPSMDQICTDFKVAKALGKIPGTPDTFVFPTADFEKMSKSTQGDFDRQSIMLYPSNAWIDPRHSLYGPDTVPLVLWKKSYEDGKAPNIATEGNSEFIAPNWDVSKGDLEGIQALYPWRGPDDPPDPTPTPNQRRSHLLRRHSLRVR